jgi:signal transduction histidine kinase
MIVDDDPDYVALITLVLSDLDNPIVPAGSGEEALALANKQRFAVMLLDISLGGGMDGFDLASKLRDIENTAQTPIVFVSGSRQTKSHMQRGYELGAVDYLLKPCPEELLRAKVKSLADLYRRTEELRVAELRVRQSQKLESVGRLAAGIAHEINTPLQYMTGNLEYVRSLLDASNTALTHLRTLLPLLKDGKAAKHRKEIAAFLDEPDAGAILEEALPAADSVKAGIERISQIVKAMKGFSATPGVFEPTDINEAVLQTLAITKSDYHAVADVVTNLGAIPEVSCAPGDIRLALLQIIVNAGQAFQTSDAETERGVITVTTAVEGEEVVISVSDTGTGIPEEHRGHVFDPFFTTRDVGAGVGTGLSAAWAIINGDHRGSISFTTETGVGTTFVVRLPIRRAHAVAAS